MQLPSEGETHTDKMPMSYSLSSSSVSCFRRTSLSAGSSYHHVSPR